MNQLSNTTQSFSYSAFFKLIYRFGNILVSIILLLYVIPFILQIGQNKILIIPVIITLILLYFLNKHFLLLHKILPFIIEADSEKIICRNFIFSKKRLTIYFDDIESLSGGVFENKISGLMKVCAGKNSVCIGFYRKLKNSDKLITIILSNVKRRIYDEVLGKLTAEKRKQ